MAEVAAPAAEMPAGRSWRGAAMSGALAVALVAVLLVGLTAGRFAIPVGRTLEILVAAAADPAAAPTAMDERIVLLVRLPRLLLAALAGAGLALTGAALQAVFRNPLVSAQVLGISPGAAFGGVLAILMGWWGLSLLGLSFAFGLITLAAVGLVARVDGRAEVVALVLAGLVIGAMCAAGVSLVQFLADPNGSLPAIVYWLMGSLAGATWERLALAAPGLVVGIAGLAMLRFRLNVLSLDDAVAESLGVKPERERWLVFALVALIVGAQVAVSGVVGWIGLVIPHMTRFLVGPDHRRLIPATALAGAVFLVAVDTVARTLTAAEIPLGVLTALVGAPVFAVLLRRHQRGAMR
jgi:iron complex transport system permease protein